jgi:shikimate kinase
MTKNISLIGMPAAGKSSVGVILAKYLNMNFADTDIIIQQEKGKMLFELISVVLSSRAMEHLKSLGDVVYLEAPVDIVAKRLSDLNQRGVVYKKGQTIKDIFMERVPLYEKWADLKVDSSSGRPEDVMNFIINSFSGYR